MKLSSEIGPCFSGNSSYILQKVLSSMVGDGTSSKTYYVRLNLICYANYDCNCVICDIAHCPNSFLYLLWYNKSTKNITINVIFSLYLFKLPKLHLQYLPVGDPVCGCDTHWVSEFLFLAHERQIHVASYLFSFLFKQGFLYSHP